jgi:uncharacterized protein with HEPN domain
MKDSLIYLKDIVDNIERVDRFIATMSCAEFTRDEKTYFAVVRCFEIMGEAVKHVPQSIREQYADVPWRTITDTRNAFVHAYASINAYKVWQTAIEDLPPLKKQILKILADLK